MFIIVRQLWSFLENLLKEAVCGSADTTAATLGGGLETTTSASYVDSGAVFECAACYTHIYVQDFPQGWEDSWICPKCGETWDFRPSCRHIWEPRGNDWDSAWKVCLKCGRYEEQDP